MARNLKVDQTAFSKNSKSALGKHYVKRKETQYLVTAVEIALMCRGMILMVLNVQVSLEVD